MFKTVMSNLMTQIVPIWDCLSAETISYSDNKSKKKKKKKDGFHITNIPLRKFSFTKYFNLKESSVLNCTFIS